MLQWFIGNLLSSLHIFLELKFIFSRGCILVLSEKVGEGWVQSGIWAGLYWTTFFFLMAVMMFMKASTLPSKLDDLAWRSHTQFSNAVFQWRKTFQCIVDEGTILFFCQRISCYHFNHSDYTLSQLTVVNSYDIIQRLVELFVTYLGLFHRDTWWNAHGCFDASWRCHELRMISGCCWDWNTLEESLFCSCCNSLGGLVMVVVLVGD